MGKSLTFWVTLVIVLTFLQKMVLAQPGELPLSLEKLLEEALARNPLIKSAESRWHALQQRPQQVSTLPDPQFGYSRFGENVETRVGPQESVVTLSQSIPFPGKLGLKGKMAEQDALVERQHFDATARDVIYLVKSTYYDLFWVDQSLAILDQYLALLGDFTVVAEQQYATGQGIQANVLKSQVEISNTTKRRFDFEKMRRSVVAKLNALLGRPHEMPLGIASAIDTARLSFDESALLNLALARREEIQSIQAMVGKSEILKSLAKRNYWPDFNLKASYINVSEGLGTAPDAGKNAWSVSVGLNLPIWLGKRKAAVREADAMISANRFAHENLKNQVRSEIKDYYYQIEITAKTLALYEQGLITQAESSLESAMASYRTGRLDFLDLLDAERMLLNLKLGYAKEQASYQEHLAALERTVGGELK